MTAYSIGSDAKLAAAADSVQHKKIISDQQPTSALLQIQALQKRQPYCEYYLLQLRS